VQLNDKFLIIIMAAAVGMTLGLAIAGGLRQAEALSAAPILPASPPVESASGTTPAPAEAPLEPAPPLAEAPIGGSHLVERIISGDIVTLENIGPVRLLGVDARLGPMGKPLDPESSRTVLQGLVAGKQVDVEYDPATADTGFKDEIDLPLVYMTIDGTFVNQEMVARGAATVDLDRYFTRRDELIRAEREARWESRGMWQLASRGPGSTGGSTSAPPTVVVPPRPTRVAPSPVEVPRPAPPKDAVLVTGDGRFHRQSCSLSRGGIPMSVQDARGKHYLACPSCFSSPRVKV
jgi:endonuclease YncB( thermonuclease family)